MSPRGSTIPTLSPQTTQNLVPELPAPTVGLLSGRGPVMFVDTWILVVGGFFALIGVITTVIHVPDMLGAIGDIF